MPAATYMADIYSRLASDELGDVVHSLPERSALRVLETLGVVGFLGYPQPGGGTHPPLPSEGVLGGVLGSWANPALRRAHKNTRSRVVRAAGA